MCFALHVWVSARRVLLFGLVSFRLISFGFVSFRWASVVCSGVVDNSQPVRRGAMLCCAVLCCAVLHLFVCFAGAHGSTMRGVPQQPFVVAWKGFQRLATLASPAARQSAAAHSNSNSHSHSRSHSSENGLGTSRAKKRQSVSRRPSMPAGREGRAVSAWGAKRPRLHMHRGGHTRHALSERAHKGGGEDARGSGSETGHDSADSDGGSATGSSDVSSYSGASASATDTDSDGSAFSSSKEEDEGVHGGGTNRRRASTGAAKARASSSKVAVKSFHSMVSTPRLAKFDGKACPPFEAPIPDLTSLMEVMCKPAAVALHKVLTARRSSGAREIPSLRSRMEDVFQQLDEVCKEMSLPRMTQCRDVRTTMFAGLCVCRLCVSASSLGGSASSWIIVDHRHRGSRM